ncbi:hypothetical protein Tco_0839398 [Tanacetum coccineum]|uniref:Uncharacterized protein n=1 Tax=Tanacetum coccineum TaxID=301880 RepID=A0ABQ5AV62_9ASTR
MKRASKGYTGVDTPLFQKKLVQGQILQGKGSTIPVESHHTPISAPSTSQPPTSPSSMQTTHVAEEAATMPHDSPLLRVHSLGSDKGSMTLNELTILCTTLSKKVETLESDLKQTKLTYGAAYTKLIMKVKKLEHKVKSVKLEEGSDLLFQKMKMNWRILQQGRKIAHIDEDEQLEQGKYLVEEALRDARTTYEKKSQRIAELQAQERERYSEADKARLLVELINERKRKFAQQRAEQRRNKPMTQAQQRTYMCNYIKNMGSHTLQQLKKLSFDEVKELFETTMKRVNTFTPMESDDIVPKVVAGSSKIDAEQELNQESSKRQKIGEGSVTRS